MTQARRRTDEILDPAFASDLGGLPSEDLRRRLSDSWDIEGELSYVRRLLHGKLDILRAELVNRLRARREAGDVLITGQDVQQLTDILAGKVPTPPEEEA